MNINNSVSLVANSPTNVLITLKCCRVGNLIMEGSTEDFTIKINKTDAIGLANELLLKTTTNYNMIFAFICKQHTTHADFNENKPLILFSDLFVPLMDVLIEYIAKEQGLVKKRKVKDE